ncbi:MAG TPA: SIMPL domain-containing protein [Beijerinckiaceae bacterium]
MSVRGVGRIEAKPDYARLSVQVVTVADTLEEAAKAHQERATRALDVLQQMKADGVEIERSSFTLNQDRPPQLPNQTQPPHPPKFRASTSFTLRFRRLDRLNQLVTRLADTGVLEVRSIAYGVDQERQALNNARRAAVADAREQAELYAEAAKVRLVEIVEIDNGEANPADGQADLPMARFVQVIPPSVVTFNSSVTITWRIRSR